MPNGFCLGCQLGLFEGLPVSFSGFSHQLTNSQETTQDDLLQGQRHLWAGKPRQTPNEGWDPEDASLRTDHFPTDGPAPTAPNAVAIPHLAAACARRTCNGWRFWEHERAPGDWYNWTSSGSEHQCCSHLLRPAHRRWVHSPLHWSAQRALQSPPRTCMGPSPLRLRGSPTQSAAIHRSFWIASMLHVPADAR